MVAPGFVPDELSYLLPSTNVLSWHQLLLDDLARAPHHAPYELHAFHHGLQVVSARIVAFIEVTEIDVRHVPGIVRPEHDRAGRVERVGLQDGPGEAVLLSLDLF